MIEKNIRLQPHEAKDLLVKKTASGERPKYQPPGGGATGAPGGSGRDVGRSDRAGHAQHATANIRSVPPPERPSIGPSLHGEGVGPGALLGQQANLRSFVRDQEIQRQAEMANQYKPTFRQRMRMGLSNLGSTLGGGLRNLAGFINPAAWAVDNPIARLGINYLGRKLTPNLYNKWLNQDSNVQDAIERDYELGYNIEDTPFTSDYLQNLDLSKYDDILPQEKSIESLFDKERTIEQDLDLATERFVFAPGSKKDKKLKALHGERKAVKDLQDLGMDVEFDPKKEKEYQDLLQEDREQTEEPKTALVAHGGRVGFSGGGIVDLWQELSNL